MFKPRSVVVKSSTSSGNAPKIKPIPKPAVPPVPASSSPSEPSKPDDDINQDVNASSLLQIGEPLPQLLPHPIQDISSSLHSNASVAITPSVPPPIIESELKAHILSKDGIIDDQSPPILHESNGKQELEQSAEQEADDEPVVQFSKDQRAPLPEEPVCFMCGRYGAYICDETDKDVCSLECKSNHLKDIRRKRQLNQLGASFLEPSKDNSKHGKEKEVERPEEPYLYQEDASLLSLSSLQIDSIRSELEITVSSSSASPITPRPLLDFSQAHFPPQIMSNLEYIGCTMPTPVQMQSLPIALQGLDLLASAPTASGKSLAFVLPSVLHVYSLMRSPSSALLPTKSVLILAPTRELCMQIETLCKHMSHGLDIFTVLIVGGVAAPTQKHRLSQDVHILVATPGRLLDLCKSGDVDLSTISLLVIDEVDSMLTMGFEDQIKSILQQIDKKSRQTLAFSATISAAVERICSHFMKSPLRVQIGRGWGPNAQLRQTLIWVEEEQKRKRLFALLDSEKHYQPPVIIFVGAKSGADALAQSIAKRYHVSVECLHGDKPQAERTASLSRFSRGESPILVSTSVLGRGIDLPSVASIINFDMPPSLHEYIHQVGRAGRGGAGTHQGLAFSFINQSSKRMFYDLVRMLKAAGVMIPPELEQSPFSTTPSMLEVVTGKSRSNVAMKKLMIASAASEDAERQKRQKF